MKKTILTTLLLVSIASIFTACSTKRYGRLQNVTEIESEYLTCKAIDVEIDKAQNFLKNANNKNNEIDKEYILGILGDFGIGNRMEYSEAIKSAKNRLVELEKLQTNKTCN